MILRDYQNEASDDADRKHEAGYRGVLLHMATGTGKTVVMADVNRKRRSRGRRVLFMAHLRELLDGASATFKEFYGADIHYFERGTEYVTSSDIRRGKPNAVFAMVQSLHKRLRKYPSDYFDDIFIDETHRSIANTYRKITSHFSGAKILGVTATPKRADKVGLKAVFDVSSDCSMSVTDGISLGWLAPLRPMSYTVESLDYSGLEVGRGDYDGGQIDDAMRRNGCRPLHEIAAALQDIARDKQTLVFVAGVESAAVLAKMMREDYHERVDFIYGGTDYDTRANILQRYREGSIQRIINVGVLTEGVDLPNTQCVAIARITRSEGRYLQMAGRGTRPFPGGLVDLYGTPYDRSHAIAASVKPECLLLDFKGNMGRVKPAIDGMELLAGLMPHEPYIGRTPSDEAVITEGRKPENNGRSVTEIRQMASDEIFLDDVIANPNMRARATVKEATVQEYKDLFGLPSIPASEKRAKATKSLPESLRADPDQRNQIIWLRKKVGMPPPTTEYLLSLPRKKAPRVIADLLERAHNYHKWLERKRRQASGYRR